MVKGCVWPASTLAQPDCVQQDLCVLDAWVALLSIDGRCYQQPKSARRFMEGYHGSSFHPYAEHIHG